jgi:hypothetical protein
MRRDLKIGDLVNHCLFLRREWMGVLLRFEEKHPGLVEKAYVKMVPGTKYENYFENGYGWVYKKWLWVCKDKEEIK